jgi:multidrug efflux pump subunit AcrB
MRQFVAFTLRQKAVMNLLFVLLMVIGAFTVLRMPVERYPNIEFGKMYVSTFLPGASPEEVEILVTQKIEEALEDLVDVDYVQSSSYQERSSVVIKFTDDSDYRRRFDDVRLKVLSILGELPATAETPIFNFLEVDDWFPTISVNVAGNHSNTTLSRVAEELKIPLSQLDGVREVRLSGDFTREFHLIFSPEKARLAGVTYLEVAEALRSAGISYPAGNAETALGELVVRVDEQYTSRSDLYNTVIRRDGEATLLRLGDVVEEGYFSYRDPYVITSVDGQDCVTLQVLKKPEGNALFIAERVKNLVAELRPMYAEQGITLRITQDSSTRIADSVRVLGTNLLLGIFLVCLIIWLFMGFRNAAITTIGIPFAFLVTMVLMYLTGNSVNEVSLFAFVLVSGIIVDDAIVVVENIFRHLQAGKARIEAVIDGTAEVFLPVISATLTTMTAFLPLLLMTGMVGDFFAIVPKTIVFALAASLLECLLILPCHYLEFGPRQGKVSAAAASAVPEWGYREGRVMLGFRRALNRAILFILRFRLSSLLVLILLFISCLGVFVGSLLGWTNLVKIQFFPDNYSLYFAELAAPPGTPLEKTHQLVKEMAAAVVAEGEGQAESALGFAGYYINEDFSPVFGSNLGYIAVTLPGTGQRRFADYPENDVVAHLDQVRQLLRPVLPEGYTLVVRPEKDGPPAGKDINIRVLGSDSANVTALAGRIAGFLGNAPAVAPWLVDLQDDQGREVGVYRIRIDGDRAAEWGLSVKEVAGLAASAMTGQLVGELKLPEEMVDVRLKIGRQEDEPFFAVAGDLSVIDLPAGTLRLDDVATAQFSQEPGFLNRFQRQRAITLTADLKAGAPINSIEVVRAVEGFYETIRGGYPGASLNFAGEYQSTRNSFISLAYAFGIAVVVIFLILAAQFQSALQPLIIIAAVAFALIGVICGTVLSRTLFTINSFVAVIGVTGVVVNDSLVLVEFINRTYRQGISRREALLRATHIRLRPILLTTLTTSLGLLPMALGIPEYSTVWGTMAMTFVTGLCTATLLTILITPLLWELTAAVGLPAEEDSPAPARNER